MGVSYLIRSNAIFDGVKETPYKGCIAVEMLKEYRKTHPDEVRIRAMGWLPVLWNNAPLPTCKSLDKAFPDIPVYAISCDFHTFWCNTLALEESGYSPDDTFESGYLGKFEDGTLNGRIHEPAAFLRAKLKVFEFSVEERMENLKNFITQVTKAGVTSLADMSATDFVGGEPSPLEAALELEKKDQLDCRIHLYSTLNDYDEFQPTRDFAEKISTDFVQLKGLKIPDGRRRQDGLWNGLPRSGLQPLPVHPFSSNKMLLE